jgi:hypothetical protein
MPLPSGPAAGGDTSAAARYGVVGFAFAGVCVVLMLVNPGSSGTLAGPVVAATGPGVAPRQAAESSIPAPALPPARVDVRDALGAAGATKRAPDPPAQPVPPAPSTLAAAAPVAVAPVAAAPDPRGAEAKRASQAALEKGRTAQAIEAGERSVELDPSDAEAWLILGAAYDQRGAYAKARTSFQKCVERATRGPKGECAALLR